MMGEELMILPPTNRGGPGGGRVRTTLQIVMILPSLTGPSRLLNHGVEYLVEAI